MKTVMAKEGQIERKWYLVDATDLPLGRLASQVAAILRGKNKPIFTPNVDTGDYVVVINTDKVILTGKKAEKKLFTYHTGYIGGLKQIPYGQLLETKSDMVVYESIKGMLPKNSLGREMLTKLRVYKDDKHEQAAQKPVELKLGK